LKLWCGAAVASLVFWIMMVVSYATPQLFAVNYYRFFICQALSYAISVYVACGIPQFNSEWAIRVFQQNDTHYLMFCLIFMLMSASFVVTLPLIIYSVYGVMTIIQSFPAVASKLPLHLLSSRQAQAHALAVQIEVLLFPFTIAQVILGKMSIFAPIGCYQFLKFRYMISPHTRIKVDHLLHQCDSLAHRYLPAMPLSIYQRIRAFFALPIQPAPHTD